METDRTKESYQRYPAKKITKRRAAEDERRATAPAPIPTTTQTVMDIDAGHRRGLEHSQHAPRPPRQDSPSKIPDSQSEGSFMTLSATPSWAGSPTPSDLDDDGDETMGVSAESHENPATI